MSTETIPEARYSSFWPLAILAVGLLLWSGYQAFSAYSQNSQLNSDFDGAVPTMKAAQTAKDKLYAIAQDLVQTGTHDTYAQQIVREANIQVKANNSAPATAPTK